MIEFSSGMTGPRHARNWHDFVSVQKWHDWAPQWHDWGVKMSDVDQKTNDVDPKMTDVDPKTTDVVATFIFMIYLMYWI